MRTCNLNFPGVDRKTAEQLASDVAEDERAVCEQLSALRGMEGASLEAVGFLLGSDPARISRYLKGTSRTSLTNYIRIARALGYRSRLVLEKADPAAGDAAALATLQVPRHKVTHRSNRIRKNLKSE